MEENIKRREKLFDLMEENSALLIYAGVGKIATADEYYPFKVNTNFFYATNIEQENSALLLVKGISETRTYLFIDEYSELKEKWTGKRITFDQASELSSIISVCPRGELDAYIDMALTNTKNQYGPIKKLYLDLTPELKIKDSYCTISLSSEIGSKYPHIQIEDANNFFIKLRMVKSEYEVDCISQAIKETNDGIKDILVNLKVGMKEYEVADRFEFYNRSHGRGGLAFGTIVAGGKNATCLHYPQQQDTIKHNELVLFDLGYNYKGYSADISRTYPVDGVYEGVARTIYETVLKCNKAVIEYVHAGITNKDIQEFTKEFFTNECIKVGLMQEGDDIIKYYYHNVSHHLGLDTHDSQDRNKPYEPGNVITVEPGLYFAEYGVGVRIEDDVLITDGASIVLSKDIAKEIDDVEKLMKSRGN